MAEPTILSITIGSWANIIAAVATFVVAVLTWKTITQVQRQLVFIHKQTLLQEKQASPLLEVLTISFKGDQINISIKNIGGGNAIQIGILSEFQLAEPKVKQYDADRKQFMGTFEYSNAAFYDITEKKKIVSNGNVNFISSVKKRIIVLKPGEECSVQLEPQFFIEYSKKLKLGETVARQLSLGELKELLKANGKSCVGFSFSLVYKNEIENNQPVVELAEFIYDSSQHKTLEDAYNSKYRFSLRAMSLHGIELQGSIGYSMYKGIKSPKNAIPGEPREDELF